MSRHLLGLAFLFLVALGLGVSSSRSTSADPPQQPASVGRSPGAGTILDSDKLLAPPVRWQDDPVCQMVFFAVLEGCYQDGVQDDVVDAIVPRGKDGSSLKASFVATCPLCHPVFEALRTYQSRPAFAQDAKNTKTFGGGLDEKVAEKLKSTSRMTRLQALAPVVKTWVERKMASLRLPPEEQKALTLRLRERAGEGKATLSKLMREDPDYKQGWSLYWGCAACNGCSGATLGQ